MGLDRFTRFQTEIFDLVALLLLFGLPGVSAMGVGHVLDLLLPTTLHTVLRTTAWGGGLVLGYVLGFFMVFALGNAVERGLNVVRGHYGLKPLNEVLRQAGAQEQERERSATEARQKWFTNLNENQQRFELFSLIKSQGESLNKSLHFVRVLGLIIIILLAWILWQR